MLSAVPSNTSVRSAVWDYVEVVTAITLITVAGWFSPISYHALGYVYLLGVIALSLRISRWPALAAAILSGAAWDFFFVPPKLSFAGIHFDEGLLLTTYFAVALIGSQLTALRSAADRADLMAESEHMRQTLLDSVSHEIKTPMAVFRSAIEQLGTSDRQRREQVIVELKIAMHRLDSLVDNLLEQNRLESGVLRPNLDWCDGHELVVAARRALGSRIADHPLAIEIPPDLPIFRADAALMEQVLTPAPFERRHAHAARLEDPGGSGDERGLQAGLDQRRRRRPGNSRGDPRDGLRQVHAGTQRKEGGPGPWAFHCEGFHARPRRRRLP